MSEKINTENLYDLIVIGGGPAGLTAALYMARARYKTLVLEKGEVGGQITITESVVNYPGVFSTDGRSLTRTMAEQAKAFGAEIKSADVRSIKKEGEVFTVASSAGDFRALTVIAATGANPRHVGFKGEEEYQGRGIAYCATCDGEFFTDQDIYVIGGGFAAAEEAMFLTRYGRSVTMLVRKDHMKAAASVVEEVESHDPPIKVCYNTEVEEVSGDEGVSRVVLKDNRSGELTEIKADEGDGFGVFVFAGYIPNTSLLNGLVDLDEQGYVITNADLETSLPGLYSAGDLNRKELRQVVTATSDGALAAVAAEKRAARLHKTMGIPNLFVMPEKRAGEVKRSELPDHGQAAAEADDDAFIAPALRDQLVTVFGRFESPMKLIFHTDSSDPGRELKSLAGEFEGISPNLKVETASLEEGHEVPYVRMSKEEGDPFNYAFNGVPGGHEFSSFIMTAYNLAGPGQPVPEETAQKIRQLSPRRLDLVVSLSCTRCPEVVIGVSQILRFNPAMQVNVWDIPYAGELRDRFKIKSVPCLVIDGETVVFGQKTLDELIEHLK